MPSALSPLGAVFENDLQRLENLLELMKQLRAFGSVSVGEMAAGESFADAALELRGRLRGAGPDLPVFAGTLLLYLAGRFEFFVREIFEALCDEMAARCNSLSDLPDKMRQGLIKQTAEVVGSPGRYGFDEIEVRTFVITLASNMTANGGLGRINSACLSITERNMTATMLAELFKRAGVDSLWPDVGKQAPMKIFFAADRDSTATKEAQTRLDEIMNVRNRLAHPSGSTTFPDFDQVLGHLRFLRTLASVLQGVLEVYLAAGASPIPATVAE